MKINVMKTYPYLLGVAVLVFATSCEAQVENKEQQLSEAIQAAPDDKRDGAMVMGYTTSGELVVLREGTNELICMADDPKKEGFNAVCYHRDLEPFMARGRELRAEGKTEVEIFNIREKEAREGTLKMPNNPTTLHVLSGPEGSYNPESGKVERVHYRYVVYIPFATPESTGLPVRPLVPGGPWIMDPGTHKAHIMISPPKEDQN